MRHYLPKNARSACCRLPSDRNTAPWEIGMPSIVQFWARRFSLWQSRALSDVIDERDKKRPQSSVKIMKTIYSFPFNCSKFWGTIWPSTPITNRRKWHSLPGRPRECYFPSSESQKASSPGIQTASSPLIGLEIIVPILVVIWFVNNFFVDKQQATSLPLSHFSPPFDASLYKKFWKSPKPLLSEHFFFLEPGQDKS